MDIVSRLKDFINFLNIPVTQFADNCKIPRPSLSQLLNGRNKKVSDEFIGKIHEAYPQLSVMWLMFGEGSMLFQEYTTTSEPQNSPELDFSYNQPIGNEPVNSSFDFDSAYTDSSAEKNETVFTDVSDNLDDISMTSQAVSDNNDPDSSMSGLPRTPTISFNPSGGKSIVNIIVYYSDNSFESFIPSGSK